MDTSMKVETRRAAPGDENAWRGAVEQVISSEDRDDELISYDETETALADDRCYMLIAEVDEDPVGLLSGYRFPDLETGGLIVYLYDIEVLESHRTEGVGSALIDELMDQCDADDVRLIWAGTDAENWPARHAFESTGGELAGESYVEYEWDLDE